MKKTKWTALAENGHAFSQSRNHEDPQFSFNISKKIENFKYKFSN